MAMRRLLWNISRFAKRDDGPTAVEYAVLLALILILAMTGIAVFGDATSSWFQDSSDKISDFL